MKIEFICKHCGHKKARSPLRPCGKCGRFTFEGATEELVELVVTLIKTEIKDGRIGRWDDMTKAYHPNNLERYFRGLAKQILSQILERESK